MDKFHIFKYDLISKDTKKIWAKRISCFEKIPMSKSFVVERSDKVFILVGFNFQYYQFGGNLKQIRFPESQFKEPPYSP